MAGHVVLPWIHRVFSLMKRWGLGTYHGLRASTSTPTSTSLSSDTIGASTGTSRSRPCSGSPCAITRRATGILSAVTIPAKACRQSGVTRGLEEQRPACGRMVQSLSQAPPPAPHRVRHSSNAKCGRTWDNGISLVRSVLGQCIRDFVQYPQRAVAHSAPC